ncbi:MAG: MFS transporter [Chloroflexota bacterium]
MKAARIGRLAPDWLWTYAGVILLVSVLVNLATSFAQYTPNLTLPAMRDSLRLSYTQVGVLVTGAGVVRMASSLAFGTLAPRYGSRAIIGVATIGTGAAMLFLGAAPTFSVALIAMALLGLTTGGALTPMMGLLSPWFHLRNRGLAAGLAATGGSVAFVAAGVLVPWLTGRSPTEGWRHTWYLFGVVVLVVGVLALIFLRDRPHPPAADRPPHPAASRPANLGAWPLAAYRNPAVWLVTALAFCSGWSQGIFSTFFGSYLSQEHGIPLALVGRLLVLMGLLSLASGVLWGRASDRLGRGQAFLLSFLLQGLAYAMFWLMPTLGPLVVSSVLMGLTLRAGYTICAAAAGDYVPPHFSAAAFGLMSVGAGLGSSISPVLAGVIADATGTLGWGFAQAVAGAVVGIAGSFLLHRSPARPTQP